MFYISGQANAALGPRAHRCFAAPAGAAVRSGAPLARVIIKPGKGSLFTKHRNPLVYGDAVARVEGSAAIGDPVLVCDAKGHAFAWGFYNPTSMYRVR